MLTKKDKQDLLEMLSQVFVTKGEMLQFKDEILGEIKSLRKEVTVVMGYRQHIADLDERVEKLEEKVFAPAHRLRVI